MAVLALAGASALTFATGAFAAPAGALHGYCAGALQCVDNGTNSPTSNNPPVDFGFTSSPAASGVLSIDVLVPDNAPQPTSFSITGSLPGTATLVSSTAWTTDQLDAYLGISASPSNPIGAYLPSTQALDPGATGFFVYQANLGSTTLNDPSNPNVFPLENISPDLALGSYIVAFLDKGGGAIVATANSGAIFETSSPPPPVPEPASIAVLGLGLLGLGVARARRS